MRNKLKPVAALLAAVMLLCMLAAYGGGVSDKLSENINSVAGSADSSGFRSEQHAQDYGADYDVTESETLPPDAIQTDRKLVRTASLRAEVKDYGGFIEWLQAEIASAGGYAESMSEDQDRDYRAASGYSRYDPEPDGNYYVTRRAEVTVRIPDARLDGFLDLIGQNANITYRLTDTEDVTLHYFDVQGHIDALQIQLDRLNELLAMAESLDDVLAIESRLSDVRAEMNSYQSSMKVLENQIDYATVNLTIKEVASYSPNEATRPGFLGQLRNAFKYGAAEFGAFLRDFALWLTAHVFHVLLVAAITFTILQLKRKYGQKRAASPRCHVMTEDAAKPGFKFGKKPDGTETEGQNEPKQ